MTDLPTHILIVEDEADIRRFVRLTLESEGHTVHEATTLQRGLIEAGTRRPDLVVLDLGLPDGDGIDLLRHWRAQGRDVPVLILTARGTIEDKMAGFQTGTDDYLTKPFDLQELVMRLRALLRRAGGRAGDLMMLGDCQVNMATGEISREGKPVEIARREWALLSALVQARGRVLSPAQLHDSLYGLDLDVGSNTVNVHVHHLRKKLGADVIDTVRGQGFRLGARYCDSTT